ncbi:unnamed protein product [Amoebophrya sp. A120]|nr:unnamed protein product [Amoebophrya sp. A120]|eukprot:GSA120T00006290001.1
MLSISRKLAVSTPKLESQLLNTSRSTSYFRRNFLSSQQHLFLCRFATAPYPQSLCPSQQTSTRNTSSIAPSSQLSDLLLHLPLSNSTSRKQIRSTTSSSFLSSNLFTNPDLFHKSDLSFSNLLARTSTTRTMGSVAKPDKKEEAVTFYRKDYKPPNFWVPNVALTVKLFGPEKTVVEAVLSLERNLGGGNKRPSPLVLDCDAMLDVKEISVLQEDNGETVILSPSVDYAFSGSGDERKLEILEDRLLKTEAQTSTKLKTVVEFNPDANKTCMGLYLTQLADKSYLHCTQMEAEGFRKFSPFLDRPDVMSKYTVRIEADKEACPVLLSNGNLVEEGTLPTDKTRHYAVYEDPHKKPAYLFALVAGRLAYIEDKFTTQGKFVSSGNFKPRTVTLRVYAEDSVKHLLRHSLDSLIKAMKFDEDMFELEYDLDIFNIVSVKDFNMGAMENKSLNVFNEKLILASPTEASDADYERIESVVAHEYFHNWTGNRVTCRSWFELTLKEGLTVFRDQTFSTHVGLMKDTKRIDQVQDMLEMQFVEDSGPLSHPIRPESYEKIDNFYTATVYEKGAEVIRMYWTILGEEGFKRGMKKYFELFDGTAATCDDFLHSMKLGGKELGKEIDWDLFSKWLSTKGTPEVKVQKCRERSTGSRFELEFTQGPVKTVGTAAAVTEILHIPVSFALLHAKTGKQIYPAGDANLEVFHLTDKTGSVVVELPPGVEFDDVVPSLNRGFGAPIKLYYDYTVKELSSLAAFDTDMYCKYNAFDALCTKVIYDVYENSQGKAAYLDEKNKSSVTEKLDYLLQSIKFLLDDKSSSALALGKTLALPDVSGLMVGYGSKVDPILLDKSVELVREKIVQKLGKEIKQRYQATLKATTTSGFSLSQEAIGSRLLKNALLGLLQDPELAEKQYFAAQTMTERVAAFRVLVEQNKQAKAQADFFEFAKKSGSGPVMDKWFALQAAFSSNFDQVAALTKHPEFTVSNPNRFRSVVGSAIRNIKLFHSDQGRDFVKKQILALDNYGNGQVAARLSRAFECKTKITEEFATKVQKTITEMLATENLKSETREILSKISAAA